MNQSQVSVIGRTIEARIASIVQSAITMPPEPNAGDAIATALIAGRRLKVLPFDELRRIALTKVVGERYSSSRTFAFDEIFEATSELRSAKLRTFEAGRARDKLTMKLGAARARVLADCKFGKYDVEPGAALDAFELMAEAEASK